MKYLVKVVCVMLVAASIYGFTAGKGKKKKETVKNEKTTEWSGVYKGVQVDGKKKTISVLYLNADFTYAFKTMEAEDTVFVFAESKGSLSWNKTGDEATLEDSVGKHKVVYRMKENILEKIKENKKAVAESESLQLEKINLQKITDKYWKLIEIANTPVTDIASKKEPHLFIIENSDRFTAASDCNSINGRCNIADKDQIAFSKIAASMSACTSADDIEVQMLRAFQVANSYTISQDGQYLFLNKASITLARFEIDYFK